MTTGTAFCRITLVAPQGRVDVALPADVPVAELVPMVLELIGEPRGAPPLLPWQLAGAAGGVLPPAATLEDLGVLDGELLRIGPARPAPPPPVFDDPVDAVAAAVAEGARTAASGRWAVPGAALLVAVGAAASLAAVRGTGGAALAAALAAALGSAAAVAVAAQTAREPEESAPDHRPGTVAAALTAVALAAAAGWLVPPGPPAAAVLTAAAAAGVAATAGQAVLRIVAPPLVAAILVSLVVAPAAAIAFLFDVPPVALAVGAGAVALAAGPVLPRLALRLAGVPARGELAGEAPTGPIPGGDPDARGRADLARGHLAGIVTADAVLVAVGAAAAATDPGVPGPVLAAVSVAVLLLRSRAFAERLPARSMQVAALLAAGTAAAGAGLNAPGPAQRVLVAAALLGVLLAAAAGTLAVASGWSASPVVRRIADLTELVLTAAAVPLAFAATGLFAAVRGW
jgi:type VII secretion integral membrane protein EccD